VNAIVQNAIYFVIILLLTKPVSLYMYRIFGGERTFLSPAFRPVERGIYRLTGVDETKEIRWTTYTVAMLLFSLVGLLAGLTIIFLIVVVALNPFSRYAGASAST
jgi:K+-transporting ATPase ATPase A chain